MAIPESQLETWSHQGSVTQSKDTYATVRRSLEAADAAFASKDFQIFLQGSYCNDTNIYSESDVDVVIRLDSTYYYDTTGLQPDELAAFNSSFSSASYSYDDFKRDVVAALRKSFGADVTVGKKAITIAANGNRRKADVLVAAQFRKYYAYSLYTGGQYVEGICFFTSSSERIVNYPKQHSENSTTKHQATASWFKPTVRILKNMRRHMVDRALIPDGIAPSYFLEGLLYNVPNVKFGRTYDATLVGALNSVLEADRSQFVCANEQYYLLRDVSHVCWPPADCDKFVQAAVKLWDGWT